MVEKDLNDKEDWNGSTKSNEIMNIEERKHKERNKVKGEDAFNTVRRKQKKSNTDLSSDDIDKVMNLNWGLENKFLRIFMIPVIHGTSFPMIQILVNY